MSKRQVVGSMSDWSGVLKDFFRQIGDGSIALNQVQLFLEHQNPFEIKSESDISVLILITDWQNFYNDVFGIKVDFSDLQIPNKQSGFDRLIVVAKGMTTQLFYDKCKELFTCWKWTDKNLDKVVESERTAKNSAYAIWIKNKVEADKELKNLSADDLKQKNITGITLEERLIYELKYFKETGSHLDFKNITLCTGSRCSGCVPDVVWRLDVFRVGWSSSGYRDGLLRSRRVVS